MSRSLFLAALAALGGGVWLVAYFTSLPLSQTIASLVTGAGLLRNGLVMGIMREFQAAELQPSI